MANSISPEAVDDFLRSRYPGVEAQSAWGETSYFYNPGHRFARGSYFVTVKQKDGANDKASRLDRPGVWRLNIGLSKAAFLGLFCSLPRRPGKGQTIDGDWDFTTLDIITPHPVYGWMGWIAVICPSDETFEICKPMLEDAYVRACSVFRKRLGKSHD